MTMSFAVEIPSVTTAVVQKVTIVKVNRAMAPDGISIRNGTVERLYDVQLRP